MKRLLMVSMLLVALTMGVVAAEPQGVLAEARTLVEAKSYAEALKRYESIADWLARDPGLQIEWARVYSYADRNDEAVKLFERIAAQHPARAPEFAAELEAQRVYRKLNRARKFVETRDFAEAIALYEELGPWLNQQPDAGLRLEWARVYGYANRHQEAIRLFEELSAAYPAKAPEFAAELGAQRDYLQLQKARNLVEQERYGEALEAYDQIGKLLETDPGLLVEKARVMSYADGHAEAAELFERICRDYPDYEPAVLRELGDMYTWQGDMDGARAVYEQAIRENPGDVRARLGLARVYLWTGELDKALVEYDAVIAREPNNLKARVKKGEIYSWRDRLSKAWDLYDEVLKIDPGNLEALNGQARIMVWQGHHRRGAARYRDILARHPDNPEALEGLAFALHWDGREAESLEVIKQLMKVRPTSLHGGRLLYEIEHIEEPYAGGFARYMAKGDHRDVLTLGAKGGKVFNYTTRLEGSYQNITVNDVTNDATGAKETIRMDRVGLALNHRIGEQLRFEGEIYESYSRELDEDFLTGDAALRWSPIDIVRLDGGYEKDFIYKIRPLRRQLYHESLKGSLSIRPDRFWMFGGTARHTDYSDDNEQDAFLGLAELRLHGQPYAKLYYNYYISGWDRAGSDYFSIEEFTAHTLGLYGSVKASPKLFIEGQGSLGIESHEEFDGEVADGTNWFLAGGLLYRMTPRWALNARAQVFQSKPDHEDGFEGYRERVFLFGVTYYFGLDRRSDEVRASGVVTPPAPRDR